VSEYENPVLQGHERAIDVDVVRELSCAATPHFALHVRNRISRLVEPLDPGSPTRQLAEVEIARLERLAVDGRRVKDSPQLGRLAQSG
jgi:hypothetical protein